MKLKNIVSKTSDKIQEKTSEKFIVGMALKFYKKIWKQCRGRNDIKGMKLTEDVIKAIKSGTQEEISEAQAILSGHLQVMKDSRRMKT